MNLGREVMNVLLNHPDVYVEGLGQFSRVFISAKYDAEEKVYLPPVTYIEFDPYEADGLSLIQYLQKARGAEYAEIQEELKQVVASLKERVSQEGSVFINHLGHLFPHGESFVFKPVDVSGFDFEKVREIERLDSREEATAPLSEPSVSAENEETKEEEEVEAPYHSEEKIDVLDNPDVGNTDAEVDEDPTEDRKDEEEAPYRFEERTAELHEPASVQEEEEETDEESQQDEEADPVHAVIQSEEGQVRDSDIFVKQEEGLEEPEHESTVEDGAEVVEASPQEEEVEESHEVADLVVEDSEYRRKSSTWYIVGGILLLVLVAVGYYLYLPGDLKKETSQTEAISQTQDSEEQSAAEPMQEDVKEAGEQAAMDTGEENVEISLDDKHQIIIGAHKNIEDAETQRDDFIKQGISTVRIVSRDREGPAQHMVVWDSFDEKEKADSVLRIVRSKYVRDAWRKDL